MRRASVLLFALVLGVATAILLEVVLQLLALAAWFTMSRREPAPEPNSNVVLCVGDSYTFGLGTSDRRFSYPARLETLLRERLGADWNVANHGWPGRNSREILERIDAQLRKYRPRLVYVIAGINDFWTRPEPLPAAASRAGDAEAGSFRWEWRTGRLIAWLTGEHRSGAEVLSGATAAAARRRCALADTAWILNGIPFVFAAAGPLRIANFELTWTVDGATLYIASPAGVVVDFGWKLDDGRLLLSHAALPTPLVLTAVALPGPDAAGAGWSDGTEGWALLNHGDAAAAEQVFRRSIAAAPDGAPYDRSALVQALLRQDKGAEAADEVAWLARRYTETGGTDLPIAEAYIQTLDATRNTKRAKQLVHDGLARFPKSPFLWERRAWYRFQDGDLDAARAAIRRSLALTTGGDSGRPWRLEIAASIDRDADPRYAARCLVEAFRLHRDRARCIQDFQNSGYKCTRDLLDAVLAEIDTPPEDRRILHKLFAAARDDEAVRVQEVYAEHMRRFVRICRERGAVPVLATYPWHDARLDPLQRRIAREEGAGFVDVATAFDRALAGKKKSDFFVSDGHCNDQGYAVLAAAVAADAARRIRGR